MTSWPYQCFTKTQYITFLLLSSQKTRQLDLLLIKALHFLYYKLYPSLKFKTRKRREHVHIMTSSLAKGEDADSMTMLV